MARPANRLERLQQRAHDLAQAVADWAEAQDLDAVERNQAAHAQQGADQAYNALSRLYEDREEG